MRLQKYIAQHSAYSRRSAEKLISAGKVQVNGKVVTKLGTCVNEHDKVSIANETLYQDVKKYYLLNKPLKVISSCQDNFGRLCVVDLIPDDHLFPIGRLDYYTKGLILLTNDGTLAQGLMHPKNHVKKTYIVKFEGKMNPEKIKQLANGVKIDNYVTKKAYVKLLAYDKLSAIGKMKLTIFEGKNRQVRKMLEQVGCRVLTLTRSEYAIFNLEQEQLPQGAYRSLKPKEIKQLYHLIGKEQNV